MRKAALVGVALGAAALFTPESAHAIRVWSASTQQFLDINFLIQTWFRYQKIDDQNRPNFIKAPDGNFDTSFRRIRFRLGGSYNKYFKFNFVIRLNNTGRDAYVAPFGGQPVGYLRQGGLLGGRNFALHELDLKFALHEMFGAEGWIIDAHLGFPRVPLGREQYGRTGFDNLESDRTFATLRWTHLTVANVTGRAYGGFIHVRKGNKGKGFGKITWDGFVGIFDGFKGIEQPWDETVRGLDTTASYTVGSGTINVNCNAQCLAQLRSNSKDSFLYTLRTTLMLGKPEGKPKGLNWLYRDTYLGKRKGITVGLSYAMQNDIDQELITDTQGIAPGLTGSGDPLPGVGSVQVRVPYMILPNPIVKTQVINNPVDMQMYGADLAVHYGPFTFITEIGQNKFKGVWLSSSKPSETFKNNWFIVKAAYVLNPGSVHLWEPYVSYYEWDPDIKEAPCGTNTCAYGDAANFIRPSKLGKNRATLGKIKVTSVGINYWYDKAKLFGWTFEYQMYDEERNEIDNDAFTVQFRFVF
ncbi:MAG: porin [Aquificae bacterium]|nr:porin [Aquificota bacterium]